MSSNEMPISELKEAIREFMRVAEKHGQIFDLIPFVGMASILKLIDKKHNTDYYDAIVEVYLKLSRSAPSYFETYITKIIGKVAKGLEHKTQVVSMFGKKTKIFE